MMSLCKHLARLFAQVRRTEGWVDAVSRFVGAARAFLYYRKHRELFGLEVIRKYISASCGSDALFHLSHRHYLSTQLSWRQRIECALTHYRCEDDYYLGRYKDAVYRGAGITLWSKTVDNTCYSLVLRATTELRHEGGISVVLLANDACLSEMSFAWVNAAIFGMEREVILFITRNQSVRHDAPALQRFRQVFPQNSPSYFCLAAVHGIAEANGKLHITGIKHDCQVAFDARYTQSFRSSYCDFWRSFGGVELDRQSYLMAVPLLTPALAKVKANHRRRAVERRRHWSEITESAAATTSRYVHDRDARECAGASQVSWEVSDCVAMPLDAGV